MSTDTDTLFAQSESLYAQAEAFDAESSDYGDQAVELGWEEDAATSKQATEILAQSWTAMSKSAETWGQYTIVERERWAEDHEELSTLYTETDALYTQWKLACDAAAESCNKLAELYGAEASEEEIDQVWAEFDEIEKSTEEYLEKISANEEQIASLIEALPEDEAEAPEDEESEEEA